VHGITKDEPDIDIPRIREIRSRVPQEVTLVLHAGSGIPNEVIREAIEAGISNIHISTEIREMWKKVLLESLQTNISEYAPYKVLSPVISSLEELISQKIRLFRGV
jgi:fructose-bisphosphate aldolase class II